MPPVLLCLWGGIGLAVTVTVGCFLLAGPGVALRSRPVGMGAAVAWVAFWLLLFLDSRAFRGAELLLFIVLLLLSLSLWVETELWLVRAAVGEVEERVVTGCAGLFIGQRNSRQVLLLTVRNVESRIRLLPLGRRLTCVILPSPRGRGKVRLLLNWLGNQFPGPFPRPRIRLKGGNS